MTKNIFYYILMFLLFNISVYSNIEERVKRVNVFKEINLAMLLKKADSLFNQSKYKESIDIYNEALNIASKKNLNSNTSYIYKKIGNVYYKLKQYGGAKIYYLKSIVSDSLSIDAADSYLNLSLIFRKQKQSDSLFICLDKSLGIYSLHKDSKQKFSTYIKAGILYKNKGMYDKAMKYLLLAYTGFNENAQKKASVSMTISTVQRLLGNYDMAKKYSRTALEIRILLKDSFGISNSYNNLANLYNRQQKYDSAINYYSKSIVLKKKLNYRKELGSVLANLASVYQKKNDFEKAFITYSKALDVKKKERDTLSMVYSYNELGILSIKKDTKISKKYLDSAFNIISSIHNKDVLLRNYEGYAMYYNSIKNYKKELEFNKKYIQLYKSLLNEHQSKNVQELQEKFESSLKQQKITELTLSNLKREKTIDTQKHNLHQKNWYLILAGFIILLGLGMYLFLKQKHKAKEHQYEFQKLEAVFKGQEIIKENISKDLHDIISTSYDGIRLKILALTNSNNSIMLSNEINREITEINHQIRLVSHRLSPLGDRIKNASLREIIISQLSEFQYYRKIFVNIQLPLPEELDLIKLEAQTNFYGIILEVLNNIEKHSQATEVKITHSKIDNNNLTFTISDNGIGMSNVKVKGIGLVNIKQRAILLNGQCTVNSSKEGSEIIIMFPININMA